MFRGELLFRLMGADWAFREPTAAVADESYVAWSVLLLWRKEILV